MQRGRGGMLALAVIIGSVTTATGLRAEVDSTPAPPGSPPGDAARGRIAVADRDGAHCLLCHRLPIPEERFHGDLGPSLLGIGSRLTPAQIRFRIMDQSRLNSGTIMPPYFRTDGLTRVASAYQSKTVLNAQQIEDIVAYLASLRE